MNKAFNRATSAYTLRLPDQAATDLVAAVMPIIDHGSGSVSFRAGGDEEAVGIITVALARAGESRPVVLTTGVGVHKRQVWEGHID